MDKGYDGWKNKGWQEVKEEKAEGSTERNYVLKSHHDT